jgi:hypothetical protein
MWLTDLFLSLPQLPLLLLLIYLFRDTLKMVFGPEVGVFLLIVVVIGMFRWMPVARLVRAQFFSLREKEFVEAARALGASLPRQVVRHILPNSLGPVVVPRPGFPARHSNVGPDPLRLQGLSRHRAPFRAVPRSCDLPRGAHHQLHRRWPARRARSAQGDVS